jgi:hypothetical protein
MLPQRQSSPVSRPQCKGTLFVNLKSFVEKRGNNWQELVSALEERDRSVLDGMMLVGGWYPVGVWNRLLEKYLAGVRAPSTEMAEIARYVADHDLNTLYKALLRMGSPAFVLARSDAIWRRYFDVGTFGHSELGPREWSLWLEAPAHSDQGPDVWTCNEGVSNWLTHALRLTGAKTGVVTHVRCRFQGAPRCEYQARW